MHSSRVWASLLFCLLSAPAMAAMPTFVGCGTDAMNAAAGSCSNINSPGTHQADDIILWWGCGESDDDGIGISLSTANGFVTLSALTELDAADDDALEENPEINCETFWKRATSGAETFPTITDSGDHTSCGGCVFRGVKTTGDPWNITSSGTEEVSDTTVSIPGATTTADNVLVVLFFGSSANISSTAQCSAYSNGDLANLTEIADDTSTQGLGGGWCVATGEKASAGAYGATTLTSATSTFKVLFSVGLEGAAAGAAPTCTVLPLLGAGGCKS